LLRIDAGVAKKLELEGVAMFDRARWAENETFAKVTVLSPGFSKNHPGGNALPEAPPVISINDIVVSADERNRFEMVIKINMPKANELLGEVSGTQAMNMLTLSQASERLSCTPAEVLNYGADRGLGMITHIHRATLKEMICRVSDGGIVACGANRAEPVYASGHYFRIKADDIRAIEFDKSVIPKMLYLRDSVPSVKTDGMVVYEIESGAKEITAEHLRIRLSELERWEQANARDDERPPAETLNDQIYRLHMEGKTYHAIKHALRLEITPEAIRQRFERERKKRSAQGKKPSTL
jgi:hypothetical protein